MTVQPLTPLRFEPILRRLVWGGRRLGTMLGKPIGDGSDYAESWEIVDRSADQSLVAAGPLAGKSLGELMAQRRKELLGRHQHLSRFPLLFKFLDANQKLSVQVHPNDEQAARMPTPDSGKTEAWVVVHAEPGSVIYAGVKRGFDRAAFERELLRGTAELCLHRFEPQVGDCLFIPAGTIHALGAGLVIAEIQQSSDTTFRLFDWNRVGLDGRPRPLHIEQGLAVTNFQQGPIETQTPRQTSSPDVQRLVECDKFVLDRWQMDSPRTIGGDDRCHFVVVLDGSLHVAGDPHGNPLKAGQTMLLPASLGVTKLTTSKPTTMLDVYLP